MPSRASIIDSDSFSNFTILIQAFTIHGQMNQNTNPYVIEGIILVQLGKQKDEPLFYFCFIEANQTSFITFCFLETMLGCYVVDKQNANPLDPSNFPFILLDNCPNFIISPGWIKVCQNTQLIDSLVEVIEPFSILGLQHGATDFEIKKAYRNLGL